MGTTIVTQRLEMKIRESVESDLTRVLSVQLQAFGEKEGHEVAGLVDDLLKDPTAKPALSLVAIENNQVVGYILFTHSNVIDAIKPVSSVILAPLAVIPDRQNQGVGSQLIEQGLKKLSKSGVEMVFVLGHPEYYPRHGFKHAGDLGFRATYPIPEKNANAWMVKELAVGSIAKAGGGKVLCAKAMDKPEYWHE